jgi:O-antigen biosynthesis protein WbqP
MIRFLDILFSFIGLIVLSPLIIILLIIGFFDTGSPIFIQERVGRHKKRFKLVKFRSMHINTPSLSTHMVSSNTVTKIGSFLRKFKLDEILQLWNVLIGDMSLVGPRPSLLNQEDIIFERSLRDIYKVRPGITGLAQIKKIDMSTPKLLAETDEKMINKISVVIYFSYIFLTVFGYGFGDRIKDK